MRILQVTVKTCGTKEMQHHGLPINYPIIYLNVLDLKCKNVFLHFPIPKNPSLWSSRGLWLSWLELLRACAHLDPGKAEM